MRQGRKIRSWMVGEGLTNVEVGRRAAAKPEYVSETIHGKRHHRRVLQVLVDAGCPARLLDLPTDMTAPGGQPGTGSTGNGDRQIACLDRRKGERRKAANE